MNTHFDSFKILATTTQRKNALGIIQAGLTAIDTSYVVREAVSLQGIGKNALLYVKDRVFHLADYDSVHLIGFGKAVCEATLTLESILGDHIDGGVVIGTAPGTCESVRMYEGSHPIPSTQNVNVSKEIVDLSERLGEKDLVLVVVSGGGSALLCWPPEECEQGQRLYHEFLKTGGSIQELNTVRKHISSIKGGGLAKILYPATVVGLIFSDVPGNDWSHIASGPTYKDTSTVADAEAIIKKYSLGGGSTYLLKETPKEDIYFEKVTNIPLVSNQTALDAMAKKGRALGYNPVILSNALYESPERVRDMMFDRAEISHDPVLVLAGGEPSLQIPKQHGKGGRNEHLVLSALDRMSRIKNSSEPLFISIGSDGIDNTDAAGAIADTETLQKATALGLDPKAYLDAFDSYHFFEKTGDLVFTGSTGANVSDLMVVLQDEKK